MQHLFLYHRSAFLLITWSICLCLPHQSTAQTPSFLCDVLNFQNEGTPFVEIHLDFESSSLTPLPDSIGWRTKAEVQVIIESANTVAAFSKTEVLGVRDSTSYLTQQGTQFHLERLTVPAGSYKLAVTVKDANIAQSKPAKFQMDLVVPSPNKPQWADIFLVGAYAPSDLSRPTAISRSGYDMLPLVGATINEGVEQLQFYTELYEVHDVVDSLFLVSAWIESERGIENSKTRRFYRKKAASIVPIFTSIPIDHVNWSENQNLVIQASTRNNEVIAEKRLTVRRTSLANEKQDDLAVVPSYFRSFTDSIALLQHVKDHHPLGDQSEQQTIDHFMNVATVNQMQAFLSSFWSNHAPLDPEGGWRKYATAVAYSDSLYGACRNNHGAMTDMGYVYLRYGPPNTIVKRHNETDYYPYEIWHYHRAGPFTNKRFLFYSPHMVAECFALLHSDMLGEVQNNDWLHILRNRENSLRVTESQLNRLNPRRDTFSGEEPEDLFFNPR
jgi:GWxTD domain-containing protein